MKMGAFLLGVAIATLAAVTGWLVGAAWGTAHTGSITDIEATLTVGMLGAAVAILAAVIAVWGVYSQRVLTRRQTTIQHIAALKSDRWVQEQIDKFIELIKSQDNLAVWANECHEGSDEALAINTVLNVYELISTGVQHGIFEYKIVERWQRTTIKRYWKCAHPYVVAIRQRANTDSIWIEFERLNDWVSGRKSPFFALWWTGFN